MTMAYILAVNPQVLSAAGIPRGGVFVATALAAVVGTSTTTTYVESASGVMAGGRTGLTGAAAAALFALSLVFAPVFLAIPGFATAPALIVVGYMMLSSCADIDWQDAGEALPAFLAVAAMPSNTPSRTA